MALLSVNNLQTYFYTRAGVVKAVDGVSFDLEPGKTLGIVGESGSGKSVTMMSILGLIPQPPGKIVGGQALFRGKDLLGMNSSALRKIRGDQISMIFQDPMTSLNPYLRISTQLTEVLTEHGSRLTSKQAYFKAIECLEKVGIPDASKRVDQYPHQFSGGMRQRVMIAMGLISDPMVLIADEPTTALDVTIQAQILTLLKTLQREHNLAIILITHDLGVVAGVSDEVLVMYAGKPVEAGSVDHVFYNNHHPYTKGLLKSTPDMAQSRDKLYSIPGLPPDPSALPPGCPFAPRCDQVMTQCQHNQPIPKQQMKQGHYSICYLSSEGAS